MAAQHPSANNTSWGDPGYWVCYRCHRPRSETGRVVLLPGSPDSYYCEPCLMTAVIEGELVLGAATPSLSCANCGDNIDPDIESVYCYGCSLESDGIHDECYRCCTDCGHEYIEAALCESCLDEVRRQGVCPDCGEEGRLCPECNRTELLVILGPEGAAIAAQPVVTTDDGKTFRTDDGVEVNWT